jgi:hypothetical protein
MPNLPLPKPVLLDQPGPYVLPTAERLSSLGAPLGALPIQIRFFAPGGLELHLPATESFLRQLYIALKGQFDEGDGVSYAK